jgi:glucose-6-phosphate 1-epimerase
MHPDDLTALNTQFGLAGAARFVEGEGGGPVVDVRTDRCAGRIALQGAQLLAWAPLGQAPVIWLSPRAKFGPGQSVRGGIPVCWPWFGPHPSEPAFPTHGFARTASWQTIAAERLPEGAIRLGFRLLHSEASRQQWPHSTLLEIRHSLGAALEVELWSHNRSPFPVVLTEALHAYFAVSDVGRIQIQGLDGCAYADKLDGYARKRQAGPLEFAGETDRVYLGSEGSCLIEDPGLGRRIRIEKRGSRSTAVWNPWAERSAALGDFAPDGYRGMVCVETANVLEDAVTLPPGGEHRLGLRCTVEAL